MNAFNVIRTALSDRRNATVAIVVTVLAGVLLYWLSAVRQLFANNPFWFGGVSLFLAAVTSVLFGLDAALLLHKYKLMKQASAGTTAGSVLGLFGSAVASGCPVCGSTLFAVLGLSGGAFLGALPLKGLEIKLLSIGLLLVSLFFVAKSLDPACKRCVVKKK